MTKLVDIVTGEQGALLVSSVDFAQGLNVQHKNLLATIRAHQQTIEEGFGLIAFQTRNVDGTSGKGRPEIVAYLTEDQALFIGSLSRKSKRIIEFKSVLVRSFSKARQRLQDSSNTDTLLHLIYQQNQLLVTQQQQIDCLRSEVNSIIKANRPVQPKPRLNRNRGQLPISGLHEAAPSLLFAIHQKVDEYCERNGFDRRETWKHLYRRFYDVCLFNVHRINLIGSETILDAIGRYGRLNDFYKLVIAELNYPNHKPL